MSNALSMVCSLFELSLPCDDSSSEWQQALNKVQVQTGMQVCIIPSVLCRQAQINS